MDSNYILEISDQYLDLEVKLSEKLMEIDFGPKVHYIYNPLDYAYELHKTYVDKYCSTTKKIAFLGMNPGPWGMMQNGVPFGDVVSVKEFLNISGNVSRPLKEHPSRPVLGLNCKRSEVSGKRFWALASLLGAGEADNFFQNAFVLNYFPLCFLNENGKNVTPPELTIEARNSIEMLCDKSLSDVMKLFNVGIVIAIGRFAEKRAKTVIKKFGLQNIEVVTISHPSPRNPASNKDWVSKTKQIIMELDLLKYFCI